MTRLLLIAAGAQLTANLAEQFEALGGYVLQQAEGRDIPDVSSHSAAILDGAHCDAAALAQRLRACGFTGVIVAVDAADALVADVALTRPFRFADLLRAIEAPAGALRATDHPGVRLTEKEAAILDRLVQARGAIISKSALLADVWGYGPNVATRTLETHIHRLRRKIEADPDHPRRLLTENGGYRLTKPET